MRQHQNLQLAQSIKGGLSDIQQGLQQNAQYKKFVAKNKTATDAKANYYATVQSSLKDAGLDISKFPELSNAPSDISNPDITVAQFMENITKPLETSRETILGKQAVAEQTPEVRGFRQPNGVGAIDSMAQPQPAGGVVDNFTARLMEEQKTGTYDPTVTAESKPFKLDNMEPDLTDEQKQKNNTITAQQDILKDFKRRSDAGMLSPGDAAKFHDKMAQLTNDDNKLALEESKRETLRLKAQLAAEKESAGKGVISAVNANMKIIDNTTGKPAVGVNYSEAMGNPARYSVVTGSEVFRPPSNVTFGGAGKNPDELKLAAAMTKRLAEINKADFTIGEDALGNTKYIAKPGSYSAKVLATPELYNQKALEYFPQYAKTVGIKPSITPTRGSGF
jgi:hypothetical protein